MHENSNAGSPLNSGIIFTAIVSVILTVLLLDWYGWLSHPTDKEPIPVESLHLVAPAVDEPYRMSSKANWESTCIKGYIALINLKKRGAPLLLVDSNNRGVRCNPSTP